MDSRDPFSHPGIFQPVNLKQIQNLRGPSLIVTHPLYLHEPSCLCSNIRGKNDGLAKEALGYSQTSVQTALNN